MEVADAAPGLGGGRFELRGTLGAGGAGTVYRAFDREREREVALKLVRQARGRELYRFKREFRALADIVHPNLLALHELHAEAGDWYFTMELVDGVSFLDWVRPAAQYGPSRTRQDIQATPVDEQRLRGALVQLIDALIALHTAGKLHRDLKPSNVLVTETGRVALIDFGLVIHIAEANPERLAVGTPVYMSPEQASDQPLGEASDWYSVGAMLYEALTGRRPFEGESERVMTRKQTELPSDPRQLVPNLPADLVRLCMWLLQPSPGQRPSGYAILDLLGASPSERTRDIARSARTASFVGRTRELGELNRALGDSQRRAVAVVVKGTPGIGKTACVHQFVGYVGDSVFVLEGRCFEREHVPFKMLDGVIDMLTGVIVALPAAEVDALAPRELGSLIHLFPVVRRIQRFAEREAQSPPPADPVELRRRGFGALRALLGELSRVRPVLLFIDDAHWGDADSLAFLRELIDHADPGIMVVLAHRSEDHLGRVAMLEPGRGGDVRALAVTALGEVDAMMLVSQLTEDPARAEQIVAAGAGNPFVLSELARAPK